MKLMVLIFILFYSGFLWPQRITVDWSDDFHKKLEISCSNEESFCMNLCGTMSFCELEEGFCRNCLGTGLRSYIFINELGRSITSREKIPNIWVADFLKSGLYATFTAMDVYNLLDSYGSIRAFKRLEQLCPEQSINQIVFFELKPITRELLRPLFVYCESEVGSDFRRLVRGMEQDEAQVIPTPIEF